MKLVTKAVIGLLAFCWVGIPRLMAWAQRIGR